MASFADGKIEAYVGPPELGGADDLERVIVDFIAGAKSTLDIAVQEIDSRAIAQAILDARWRGVRIRIFLEEDYIRSDLVGTPPKPPTPRPGETPEQALSRVQWLKDETDLAINRQILAALLRSDIEVKGDYNPKIFHPRRSSNDMRCTVRIPTWRCSELARRKASVALTNAPNGRIHLGTETYSFAGVGR
ncbi:MAG: hypothetical protein H0W08_20475 [Acidobacteria bacterium]|nr:hypothetical protein [Acidobacteriota bacterium]